MNCEFADNTARVLDSPIGVSCIKCGRTITTHVFPIRATCTGNVLDRMKPCGCSKSDADPAQDIEQPQVPDNRVGLGDVVGWIITTLTFGRIKPWPGCGCDRRKAWLNRLLSWRWPR